MEFYENGGGAVAKLLWSSTSQSKEIIPQTQLYSSATKEAEVPMAVTNKLEEGITLYPNPASQLLNITLPDDKSCTVSIFSMQGKLTGAYSNLSGTSQFDIGNLAQGVYLVKIQAGIESCMKRFVVK